MLRSAACALATNERQCRRCYQHSEQHQGGDHVEGTDRLASATGGECKLLVGAGAQNLGAGILFTRFWHRRSLHQELYDQFQAENPDITLTFEVIDGGPAGLQQILTAAGAGNLPDVAVIDGQWVSRLVQSDALRPLGDLWPAEDRADFHPATVEAQTVDGQPYGIMFQTGMRGLLYRPSVLSGAGIASFPATWEELQAASATLKDKGMSMLMLTAKPAVEPAMIYLLSMLWGLGGEIVDADGAPVFHEGENAVILERVFGLYKELVDSGAMSSEVSVMDEAAIRPFFYGSEVVAIGASSSSVRQIWSEMPDTLGDMDVAGIPLPDGKHPVTVLGGFSYGLMATDPAQAEAGWKFISFMTATANLGRNNETLGNLPLRKSIWETNEFFSTNPLMLKFKALYDAAGRTRPSVPIYTTISTAITTELSNVVIGTITPAEAVKRAGDVVMLEYQRQENR